MSKKKKLLLSFIGSLILLIVGYFVNNQYLSIITQESVFIYSLSQKIVGGLASSKNYEDSVFFVDISANKKLYSYKDSAGTLQSYNDWLSDRDSLKQFIDCCRNAGNYRYIIVDLRFEAHGNADIDSALFDVINQTPRIVIAKNSNRDLSYQHVDVNKIALAEYPVVDNFSDFTRFPLYSENDQYIYTKVYEDLNERFLSKFGPLYFDNGRLCHNSIFVKLYSKDEYDVITTDQFEDSDEEDIPATKINQLSELLDSLEINSIPDYINKRYVVIGNFKDDDRHDTYVGYKQGSELVFSTIMELNNHTHYVKWLFAMFLLLFYFCVVYLVTSNYAVKNIIPFVNNIKSKVLHFVLSLIEYSVLFILIDIVLFTLFDMVYSFIVQILLISTYKYYLDYKRLKQ